jgi:hypothetical protein
MEDAQQVRRAARGTWDGVENIRVASAGPRKRVGGSPLWLLATVAFLVSGVRSGGLTYLGLTMSGLLVATAAYLWLRRQRRRQALIVGEGVLVFRSWWGRPIVLRTDAVRAIVLARVRWGRDPAPVLVAAGDTGVALVRVWGAEWSESALQTALNPLGVRLEASSAVRTPREVETAYPGSMTMMELHPIVVGMLLTVVGLVVGGIVLTAIGVTPRR